LPGREARTRVPAAGIAETFNIAVDYLVIPGAPRRPLHAPQNIVDARLAGLSQLSQTS